MWFELPLSGSDEQFNVSILGTEYTFIVQYRDEPYFCWMLDLLTNNGDPIVRGIPLVTGVDLLSPFSGALKLGFSLFVGTDGAPDSPPTEDNLGTLSHVYVRTNT